MVEEALPLSSRPCSLTVLCVCLTFQSPVNNNPQMKIVVIILQVIINNWLHIVNNSLVILCESFILLYIFVAICPKWRIYARNQPCDLWSHYAMMVELRPAENQNQSLIGTRMVPWLPQLPGIPPLTGTEIYYFFLFNVDNAKFLVWPRLWGPHRKKSVLWYWSFNQAKYHLTDVSLGTVHPKIRKKRGIQKLGFG